jgi:transcriptional regulator with XRE-family HTH domain
MDRPVGGQLCEAFRSAYAAAGLTQNDVVAGLHARGYTTIDQPLVSKWARGMRVIPVEILPALDQILRRPRGHLLRLAGYVEDVEGGVLAQIEADAFLDERGRRLMAGLYGELRRSASPASSRENELHEATNPSI